MSENIAELYQKYNINKVQIKNDASGKINSGGDCVLHGYDKIYDKILQPYRHQKIKLCEIGVLHGYSMFIYSKYFKNVELYGYDINIDFVKQFQTDSEFYAKLKELKLVDSTKPEQCKQIKHTFNIIIDDGDHQPESMIKTFQNFYSKLDSKGIYIIEDAKPKRYKTVKKFLDKTNINHEYYQAGSGINIGGLIVIKGGQNIKK